MPIDSLSCSRTPPFVHAPFADVVSERLGRRSEIDNVPTPYRPAASVPMGSGRRRSRALWWLSEARESEACIVEIILAHFFYNCFTMRQAGSHIQAFVHHYVAGPQR